MSPSPLPLLILAALLTSAASAAPPPPTTANDPVATGSITNPQQLQNYITHLHTLRNATLLQLYQDTELAIGVTDAGLANPPSFHSDTHAYFLRLEILRRGASIVPLLTDALKQEIATHRPSPPRGHPLGLIGADFDLLTALGEPAAVPALLDILDTGPALDAPIFNNPSHLALTAIEKLTFISFRRTSGDDANFTDALAAPNAIPLHPGKPDDLRPIVNLYRAWLAAPGKDPSQWLPLAQSRAHALLDSDNLDDAYQAASFLTATSARGLTLQKHDNDPARTANQLAAILSKAEPIPNSRDHLYTVKGKPLPAPITRWITFLAAAGPAAQSQAPLVIRLEKEIGDSPYLLKAMANIGGPDILSRLTEILPPLAAEVDAFQHDPTPPAGFNSGNPRSEKIETLRACRSAIDRSAGRSFDSDDQRLAWWTANKSKTPEQWLRDSLPITAARADATTFPPPPDRAIFHQLLPDAPYGDSEENNTGPHDTETPGTEPEPFRTQWLQNHLPQLPYDPATATFHLPLTKNN